MILKNLIKRKKKDFYILLVVFFLGLCLFLIEEKFNPSFYLNIDEKLWLFRSQNYLNAMKNFDFLAGLQTIHPGITVMALSAFSIYLADLFFHFLNFSKFSFEPIHLFAFNIPIILLIIAFFFSSYYLLRKAHFNKILSFFVILFFSSNVYYITSSTPVDKFVAISILLSLLFLIVYVNQKFKLKKYLFLAAFFSAFGILSKLSALILIPFSLFILLYYYPLNDRKIKGALKDFAVYILFLFGSLCLIFPPFLLSPLESVSKIIGSGNNVLVRGLESAPIIAPSLYERLFSYIWFWQSAIFTPLATIFFLFFLIFCLKDLLRKGLKSDFSENNLFYKNVLVLFLFGIVYFFYIVIFANLIFYRYLIPLALILNIGSAMGLYKIILLYKNRFEPLKKLSYISLKFVILFYLFKVFQLILIYNFVVPVETEFLLF